MSSSKKKKRRSSLAPARMKLDLPLPGADLCRSVDCSLPNEERLEQLAHLCIEHTIAGVVQVVEAPEVKESLQEVSDAFKNMLCEPDTKAAIKQVLHGESYQPNGKMDELESSIQDEINRFQEEEKAWLRVIEDVEKATQEAERDYSRKEVSESELTDGQRELADTYLPKLESMSSVNKTLQDACSKAIILKVEDERYWHCLQELKLEVQDRFQKSLSHLHGKSFRTTDRPAQDVIQQLIDLPAPVDERDE